MIYTNFSQKKTLKRSFFIKNSTFSSVSIPKKHTISFFLHVFQIVLSSHKYIQCRIYITNIIEPYDQLTDLDYSRK